MCRGMIGQGGEHGGRCFRQKEQLEHLSHSLLSLCKARFLVHVGVQPGNTWEISEHLKFIDGDTETQGSF